MNINNNVFQIILKMIKSDTKVVELFPISNAKIQDSLNNLTLSPSIIVEDIKLVSFRW